MIPLALTVRVLAQGARPIRLWLPLFLIWILLSPLLVIIVPVIMVLGALSGINPFSALSRLGAVFCALSGTHVEVEAPDASVFVHIS